MSDNVITVLQIVSTLTAVGVSIVALIVSHRRAKALFSQQQRNSVLPRLRIIVSYWINYKNIIMTNCGVGTAVINRIEFKKDKVLSNSNLADLFELPDGLSWDTWVLFHPSEPFLLRPGESAPLLQLSEKGLLSQGVHSDQALELLRNFQNKFIGTRILIEYSDVYGNKQNDYLTEICDCHVNASRPDDITGVSV